MKTNLRNKLPLVFALVILIAGGMSCKSNKKLTDVSDKKDTQETAMDTPEEEPKEVVEKEPTDAGESSLDLKTRTKYKLTDYFSAISGASSVASANRSIQEALNLFYSPETLVLIVINESNGKKDYDQPTTINKYLNYLKDQKKNINSISSMKMDDSGKITELELTKK